MKFTQDALDGMGERLRTLGLVDCPYCLTDSVAMVREPVFLPLGDLSTPIGRERDSDAKVLFMLLVRCKTCGYSRMFDSAAFYGGHEPLLERAFPT